MKSCLQCGTEAADDASTCLECGRDFAYRGAVGTGDQVSKPTDVSGGRPDGKAMVGLGWVGLCVGIVMLLMSFAIDAAPYGEIDPSKVAARWNLMIGGAGLANIGFLLLLVGIIVRAISFLPGRDDS